MKVCALEEAPRWVIGPSAGKEVAMVATTAPSDQAGRGMTPTVEPLLIDQFMPTYDIAVVHSRVFRAPPERCFNTVVDFDLFQLRRSGC